MRRAKMLYCVTLETTRRAAEAIEEGLEATGRMMPAWHDEDRDYVRFEAYCTARRAADSLVRALRRDIPAWTADTAWSIGVQTLPDRDWQEAWKVTFRTERVSPRIVVKPSWETFSAQPGDCVIELDPGMSFGTGRHPTTRACLRFLDTLLRESPGTSFLDLGCGSGILSIAAAGLGAAPVLGLDNDPDAIRVAAENVAANRLTGRIELAVADVTTLQPPARFAIVAANILADVLCACHRAIGAAVAPGGWLLLAGILHSQYETVRATFEAAGFRQVEHVTEEEWSSGRFLNQRGEA